MLSPFFESLGYYIRFSQPRKLYIAGKNGIDLSGFYSKKNAFHFISSHYIYSCSQ